MAVTVILESLVVLIKKINQAINSMVNRMFCIDFKQGMFSDAIPFFASWQPVFEGTCKV